MHAVLAKLIATKVLAAAVGAASVGGVAVAAATGTLPAPVQDVAHELTGAPAAADTVEAPDATDKPDTAEAADPAEATEPADAAEAAKPTAAPHPSLKGLCHAYSSGNKATHGKALQSSAFTVLLTAAGGKDGVAAYCAALKPARSHETPKAAKEPKTAKVHTPKKDKSAKHADHVKTDDGTENTSD